MKIDMSRWKKDPEYRKEMKKFSDKYIEMLKNSVKDIKDKK